MQINNITIREYISLPEGNEYDVYMDILKPVNFFCGRKCVVNKLSFDEVNTMGSILDNPNLQDVKDLFVSFFRVKGDIYESEDNVFFNESVFTFFKARLFLYDLLKGIRKKEKNMLGGDEDYKMIAIRAGERLAPYSSLLTKIQLGEQFGFRPKEIGGWRYTEVLHMLSANKEYQLVQRDYALQK